MSKAFLIFGTLVSFVGEGGYALYELQTSGYHTVLKLKKTLFGLILPIVMSVLAWLIELWMGYADYLLGGVFLIFGIVSMICYARKRTKFRFTARGLRVAVPFYLVGICLAFLTLPFQSVRYLTASVVGLSAHFILGGVNLMIAPFERIRNAKYARERTAALRKKEIIKVVITGSYGKTSTKRILTEFLKGRYEVVSSLGNYNTPLGLVKSIENHIELLESHENLTKTVVFIGEAGARRKGDINEMCRLIEPTYGIITGVAEQHLDSFGSVERIAETKEELAGYLGRRGTVVFNVDNPYVKAMSERFCGKSIGVGSGGDVEITGIKMNAKGTNFDLRVGDEVIPIRTELLGAHNAKNVALCVALALEMGVDKAEIQRIAEHLKAEPHRLEKRVSGTITVLDDSYNANILGVRSAMEVLENMDGRKVIYAQGIVECGTERRKLNGEVARLVSKVADVVILSGENAKIIEKNLKKDDFQGKIYKFSSLMHATEEFKNILKAGDILYLQNDIP